MRWPVEIDKVEKYKWAKPASPGEMKLVDKQLLNLDDAYQRERTSEQAVRRIAGHFDWTLFGVLKVAERPDGTLWVFDGGHRLRACFYRSDIQEIPCIVFALAELADEARAFIAGAKMTQRISSMDTFRAATVAMEPSACRTAAILGELGLKANKYARLPHEIKCIHTVQKCVQENDGLAKRTLAACAQMANESPISGQVFGGLFALVAHFNGRDLLTEYEGALVRLTQKEVERSIRQLSAEVGRGGTTVAAKGIMALLNKNKKTKKLQW